VASLLWFFHFNPPSLRSQLKAPGIKIANYRHTYLSLILHEDGVEDGAAHKNFDKAMRRELQILLKFRVA